MDRRYSSSSSSTATETAKKVAMNNSIRYRNGLSSDSTTASHRKSFPSTSDVGSSFNSTTQVRNRQHFTHFTSFTFDDSPSAEIKLREISLDDFSLFYIQRLRRTMSRGHAAIPTTLMLTISFRSNERRDRKLLWPHGDTSWNELLFSRRFDFNEAAFSLRANKN